MHTHLAKIDGYKTLVRNVAREIEEIEFFVKRKQAHGLNPDGKIGYQTLLKLAAYLPIQ